VRVVRAEFAGDGDDTLGCAGEDRFACIVFAIEKQIAATDIADDKLTASRGCCEEACARGIEVEVYDDVAVAPGIGRAGPLFSETVFRRLPQAAARAGGNWLNGYILCFYQLIPQRIKPDSPATLSSALSSDTPPSKVTIPRPKK
jgi:hypothetical protein